MTRNAAQLLEELRSSLEKPVQELTPAERLKRFRRKVNAAVDRGLWSEDPLIGIDSGAGGEAQGIYPIAGESTRRQWEWIIGLTRESETFDADDLERHTTVGLLNTYLPSAFTAPVGDERLIAIDNSFHDFIYGVSKYLVLASDPVDFSDPLWRTKRAGLPGRFYACARLLRLVLGTLRWYGFMQFPVDALLPTDLTVLAVDQFTEPAQLFVLGHEAGHILSGHVSPGRLTRLAVGATDVTAVDCRHETEHEADLVAAEILRSEALRSGLSPRDASIHALQAAFILFTLLDVYANYYFISLPTSHPEPQARLDRLVNTLLPDDSWSELADSRPSFKNLPLLVGLAQGDYSGDVPLGEFWEEVMACKYCLERIPGEAMPLLESCEELEDGLAEPPQKSSLLRFFQHYAPPGIIDAVPDDISAGVGAALKDGINPDEVTRQLVDQVLEIELSRVLVTVSGVSPGIDRIRSPVFEPAAGTAFHMWARQLRELLPPELAIPGVHVGLALMRHGPDGLRVVPAPASSRLEQWAVPYLTRLSR